MKIGVKLGADVPFCLRQGTARARGIGDQLTAINSKINCSLLLVTPNIEVSTAHAYNRLQLGAVNRRPQVDGVVEALETGDLEQLVQSWGNVFEAGVMSDFPAVIEVKAAFSSFGLSANLMSGSGPSIYCLNPPPDIIELFAAALPKDWFYCWTYFLNK